jgi:acetyltransferase-like isoleucine patch superfamily enzyme
MKIENFLFKIRKREGPFYSKLKDVFLATLHFNLPAPKLIFRPIYELLVLWRYGSHLIAAKIFYTPVFKARCEGCGKGLILPNGIPWIEGNLRIRIGENVSLDDNILVSGRVYEDPLLTIGDRTEIGFKTGISVAKSVRIGNDCMIAAGCFIADNDGHSIDPLRRLRREPVRKEEVKPVIIEDNVWIGTGSVILKGVSIGTGSVIAANSLVTRSVPPYSVVMGVPAQIVQSGIDKIEWNKSGLFPQVSPAAKA